jgi:hypothetical protein
MTGALSVPVALALADFTLVAPPGAPCPGLSFGSITVSAADMSSGAL